MSTQTIIDPRQQGKTAQMFEAWLDRMTPEQARAFLAQPEPTPPKILGNVMLTLGDMDRIRAKAAE